MLAYLDAFGVNLNPAIIWNAIPWSFVVDWLLGVSRWLDNNKIAFMEPQINIHRYLWSISRRRTILVQRRTACLPKAGATNKVLSDVVPLPKVTETAYRRDISLPSASSIISSGLSLGEFSLAAALVVSRRSRRSHRLRKF